MIVLRILFFILLTLDGIGTLGLVIVFFSSLMHSSSGQSDLMIWLTLLVLVGAATAFGLMLGRAGRPGLACLPMALALPFALYGFAIGALVIAPGAHH